MSLRVYAEAMYGSVLWQVVQEDLVAGRHFLVHSHLSQSDARKLAEKIQTFTENVLTEDSEGKKTLVLD